jgi:predicted naringenin-chalcone synthase
MPTQTFVTHLRALNPAYTMTQQQTVAWLVEAHTRAEMTLATRNGTHFDEDRFRVRIAHALARFGCSADKIATRGVELADGTHTSWPDMQIFRLDVKPEGEGMLSRMRLYADVAAGAFERLYAEVDQPPSDLLHVTCTGYASPSAPQRLVSTRGWGRHTRVTQAYHMGCYAALPALRIAGGFASAPGALRPVGPRRVDVVHTELCSLHVNPHMHTPEQLVVQTLFADGLIAYSVCDASARSDAPALQLLALGEQVVPDSSQAMQWICSDWGMQMTLARDVPERLNAVLGPFLDQLCNRASLTPAERAQARFAIHPGGPKILDGAQVLLDLREEQIEHSREVLFSRGNMSSATLPHVWMKMMADETVTNGQIVISAAFGPGLTLCGAVMRKVMT